MKSYRGRQTTLDDIRRAAETALSLCQIADHHAPIKGAKNIVEWADKCYLLEDQIREIIDDLDSIDFDLAQQWVRTQYSPKKTTIILNEWDRVRTKSPIGRWLRKQRNKKNSFLNQLKSWFKRKAGNK